MKFSGSVIALALLTLSAGARTSAQQNSTKPMLTAQEVVDRIKAHVGIPWLEQTRDTFKAGEPQTPVSGIAVTMMATQAVLQRAVANRQNLIITHEPTFFDDPDKAETVSQGEEDTVLADKRAFIAKNHLVIWRFHDHWHRMHPDGIELGNVHALGWEKFQDPGNPYLFTIPETTVGKLADEVQKKFGIAAVRIVGDREMKVTRVALSPGFAGAKREIAALEIPDIQVLLAGETREWETVEYVADAVTQGKRKALIVLSHVPSEQQGMDECVRWLKTFVSEAPVQFVPTPDPFAPGVLMAKP